MYIYIYIFIHKQYMYMLKTQSSCLLCFCSFCSLSVGWLSLPFVLPVAGFVGCVSGATARGPRPGRGDIMRKGPNWPHNKEGWIDSCYDVLAQTKNKIIYIYIYTYIHIHNYPREV